MHSHVWKAAEAAGQTRLYVALQMSYRPKGVAVEDDDF